MTKSGVIVSMICFAVQAVAMGDTTAEFIPQGATSVSPGTPVTFSIKLIPDIADYTSCMIVVGTNASGIDFDYSSDWADRFTDTLEYGIDTFFYPEDQHAIIAWSSMGVINSPVTTEMILGTVTLHTNGLSDTSCWVKIDYEFDKSSVLASPEGINDPIMGHADIVITPEPGTILFLGLSLWGIKSGFRRSPLNGRKAERRHLSR